jgi:hypothetical protein
MVSSDNFHPLPASASVEDVPFEQVAKWASEPVWKMEKEKIPHPAGSRTPIRR